MASKQQLIKKIRKVWKDQEKQSVRQHKKISKMLKDFSADDLALILQDEEINFGLEEYYFLEDKK